jgi:SAM-dependent methyltransferase
VNPPTSFEQYFEYLTRISWRGRVYKHLVSSPILFWCARAFGPRLAEIGSGTGAGVLGAFPARIVGFEINPLAVEYSKAKGLQALLIERGGPLPTEDGSFDACILDNVLEHITDPQSILEECWRITSPSGGLVIAVPGIGGFASDPDHKVFYGQEALQSLHRKWEFRKLFSIPTQLQSETLSRCLRQYCLVGVYRKRS